ncbi:C40 family peptidase [Corynebacterium sp. TA-R-1]|uniref:C40 family peptidase n=1 Tax=Corynebacterium stercoris TaxID=2943490 RepID=A0ABT1FY98_9CORY|nr:C40 family peptidase [Corynebacterium stercoris]
MAKHRRQDTSTVTRTVAAASAVVAGATLLAPTAQAAEVRIPNTPIAAEIPGIENVPGIAAIPGIEQWVPSLAGQASQADVAAAIDAAKALPGVTNIPSFNAFLNDAQARYAPAAPAAPAQQYAAPVAAPAPQASQGQRIVDIALSKVGAPYVYGAAGPNAFDCSGFTSWVYAQAGISIPRTSGAQAAAGTRVPLDQLQPGDIVAYYGGASHVAIYIGNGMMVDALNSGTPVGVRPLNMMPIHSAVRF